jgi:hypothetical protein
MADGGHRLEEWLGRCAGLTDAGDAEACLQEVLSGVDLAAEDIEALILFARACDKFQLHHASAALHAALLLRHREVTSNPALLAHIATVETVLTPDAETSFRGAAPFLVFSLQRLIASLAACGLEHEQARLWLREQLPPDGDDLLAALGARLRGTPPTSVSDRAVRFLEATRRARRPATASGETALVLWSVALIAVALGALAFAPGMMAGLLGWRENGPTIVPPQIFVLAGVLWPGMLLLTWLYARRRSRARQSYACIAPAVFPGNNRCLFGEIMPLRRDNFYHIFQFIWIPFAFVALYAFLEFNRLADDAAELFGGGRLAGTLASANLLIWQDVAEIGSLRAALFNDGLAILLAVLAGLIAVGWQCRIQSRRKASGRDLYWWDRRLDPDVWSVRLGMVFFDVTMFVYLLIKLGVIALLLYGLLQANDLQIGLFGAEELGGQAPFFSIYMTVMMILILFGFFLMASLYLHRNMPQYRWLDRFSLLVYLVVGAALLFWPVQQIYDNLEDRKTAEIERVLPTLRAALTDPEQIGTANQHISYIKSVESVPSALFSLDLLLSPVALLLAQALILLWQVAVRGRTAPLIEKLVR